MANVVLIGASVRALACSALRAGFTPLGADLFADWDLHRVATVERIDAQQYPSGFLDFVRRHRGEPWAYTGGLENYPTLLQQLMECGPCLGCKPEAVARVKDSFQLSELCCEAGIRFPECRSDSPGVPTDGSWLIKPKRSSGGLAVRRWQGGLPPAGSYWQRVERGTPHAAVFLADSCHCRLLGVTRQLVGESICHAPEFAYCGSIGPLALSETVATELNRLGEPLRHSAGLRGIFGVDFLIADERPIVIEVNPRYPASAEVLERAGGYSAFALHMEAFGIPTTAGAAVSAMNAVLGKAIVFAPERCRFAEGSPIYHSSGTFADLPHPGTWIGQGEPILTVFAEGRDPSACESNLRTAIRNVETLAHCGT